MTENNWLLWGFEYLFYFSHFPQPVKKKKDSQRRYKDPIFKNQYKEDHSPAQI